MKPILIAACLVMLAGVARADTGNELLKNCEDDPDMFFNSGQCVGYVVGSVEAYYVIMTTSKVCFFNVPPKVTNGQLVDIVVKYMKDNPAVRQFTAADLILGAMADAFPCPK